MAKQLTNVHSLLVRKYACEAHALLLLVLLALLNLVPETLAIGLAKNDTLKSLFNFDGCGHQFAASIPTGRSDSLCALTSCDGGWSLLIPKTVPTPLRKALDYQSAKTECESLGAVLPRRHLSSCLSDWVANIYISLGSQFYADGAGIWGQDTEDFPGQTIVLVVSLPTKPGDEVTVNPVMRLLTSSEHIVCQLPPAEQCSYSTYLVLPRHYDIYRTSSPSSSVNLTTATSYCSRYGLPLPDLTLTLCVKSFLYTLSEDDDDALAAIRTSQVWYANSNPKTQSSTMRLVFCQAELHLTCGSDVAYLPAINNSLRIHKTYADTNTHCHGELAQNTGQLRCGKLFVRHLANIGFAASLAEIWTASPDMRTNFAGVGTGGLIMGSQATRLKPVCVAANPCTTGCSGRSSCAFVLKNGKPTTACGPPVATSQQPSVTSSMTSPTSATTQRPMPTTTTRKLLPTTTTQQVMSTVTTMAGYSSPATTASSAARSSTTTRPVVPGRQQSTSTPSIATTTTRLARKTHPMTTMSPGTMHHVVPTSTPSIATTTTRLARKTHPMTTMSPGTMHHVVPTASQLAPVSTMDGDTGSLLPTPSGSGPTVDGGAVTGNTSTMGMIYMSSGQPEMRNASGLSVASLVAGTAAGLAFVTMIALGICTQCNYGRKVKLTKPAGESQPRSMSLVQLTNRKPSNVSISSTVSIPPTSSGVIYGASSSTSVDSPIPREQSKPTLRPLKSEGALESSTGHQCHNGEFMAGSMNPVPSVSQSNSLTGSKSKSSHISCSPEDQNQLPSTLANPNLDLCAESVSNGCLLTADGHVPRGKTISGRSMSERAPASRVRASSEDFRQDRRPLPSPREAAVRSGLADVQTIPNGTTHHHGGTDKSPTSAALAPRKPERANVLSPTPSPIPSPKPTPGLNSILDEEVSATTLEYSYISHGPKRVRASERAITKPKVGPRPSGQRSAAAASASLPKGNNSYLAGASHVSQCPLSNTPADVDLYGNADSDEER